MSKLLITGATGFIGRHLLEQLLVNGNDRIRVAVRELASAHFAESVDVQCVGPIGPDTDWHLALRDCDTVIHMAARVHVMKEKAVDPLEAFRLINVAGSLNLARQAAEQGLKRFIFISSVKVNGERTKKNQPFKADDPAQPEDPYALSKYEAEQELTALAAETGMELVIIRPPLVYGAGVQGNFQRMMRWLERGIPLPLAAVHNRRSLVYVENLVDLIIRCIHHPQAANQIFLVSDGEDLSIAELLYQLGQVMEKPARLFPIPLILLKTLAIFFGQKAAMQRLCGSLQVDISKTCELLNWQPVVKAKDALNQLAKIKNKI